VDPARFHVLDVAASEANVNMEGGGAGGLDGRETLHSAARPNTPDYFFFLSSCCPGVEGGAS